MHTHKTTQPSALLALLVSCLLAACSDSPQALLSSARDYLAKHDNKAAVIQIKNALQSKPEFAEARLLLGQTLLEGGDPAGAETELRKALALNHPADLVIPPLARALLAQGDAKKLTGEFANTRLGDATAQASLQMSLASAYATQGNAELEQAALAAALLADPAYAPARLAQAEQLIEQQDPDGALALTEAVISKSDQNHEAWKLKGDILLYAKHDTPTALAAYQTAVQLKPDFLEANAAITAILLQQGKLGEAQAQIAQARKFSPDHPKVKYLAAQLAFRQKDFKTARALVQQVLQVVPKHLQSLQLAGALELESNSLAQAEVYLTQCVEAAPANALARRLLITTYLRSGQSAKALQTLLPGLGRSPVDPGLLPLAGAVYLQNGDTARAEEYFTKASQQAPADGKHRTSLALVHMKTGPASAAFDELQDIAESDTGTSADLALISAHLNRREFDKALTAIARLEAKQPGNPLPAHLRARTLLAKKDIAGAKASFARALVIDPTYYPAVASLAALDLADKNPSRAKERFEAVLAKNPKDAQALLALAELAARTGAPRAEVARLLGNAVAANPTHAGTRLLMIDFHMRNRDAKEATAAAQSAAAALPDNPQILDALGRTQQATGDFNQAVATFTKLAAMLPLSPLPHMRLADSYIAMKDNAQAATSLRRGLTITPDLLPAQRALIGINLSEKKYADALATARTVQQQRPSDADGYLLEGDIHSAQNNWADAAATYRNGLKHASTSELALKLHSVLVVSGGVAEADKFSAGWLRSNPKDAAFLFYLGDRSLARRDLEGAEKYYLTVIRLQPDNAVAYNNLAWTSGKLKRDTALGFAEKANTLVPNQPKFMDTLAMLLSDRGDYARALELQTRVLSLQPANPLFRLSLAKIHLRGGRDDLARNELEDLAKMGDKFSAHTEVAGLLRGL